HVGVAEFFGGGREVDRRSRSVVVAVAVAVAVGARRGGRLARVLIHPPLPRGVYLWGGVGRGKSFLMDCFYQAVPIERKLRVHFHEFMRATHREMHDLRGTEDPLHEVAIRVARRYRLICFDEFHISDIADAMILERLLQALIQARVGFVMTSNYPPDGLYPDGLHRDRLLPAIDLLNTHLEVVELASQTDHRRRSTEHDAEAEIGLYQTPLSVKAENNLFRLFERFADGPMVDQPRLIIEAREIPAKWQAGGAIWFDFAVLCGGPRSQNDYLELAHQFHTVVLSGVPAMSVAQSSEARRFTWLVDILYDHNTRLVLSAETQPDSLYTTGVLANEFQRTASRLTEMQTSVYLQKVRRQTVESIR
ncbi:MAG: cell division protein ZapE, partial [Burkholderiaceae bacterium]